MPADFQINLTKGLTSSPEERTRFYHGFLAYLVTCTVLLVLTAFFTSVNLSAYIRNKAAQHRTAASISVSTGISKSGQRDPDKIYAELDAYARRLALMKKLLKQRVQLLPVVHNLFIELPEGVALQSLAASKTKVSFGLVMPMPSGAADDPVKILRTAWETNEELMHRVKTIRPITGERRTAGADSFFYVQFECELRK